MKAAFPLRATLPLLACLIAGPASAQAAPSGWHIMAGITAGRAPRYPGSDEVRRSCSPFATFDYKGIVGLGGARSVDGYGLYLRPVHTEKLTLGVLVVQAETRKESDARALAGMGDRRSCLFGGVEAMLDLGVVQTSLELLKGARDRAGWTGALEVERSFPLTERLGLQLAATGVWGNAEHEAWAFGVTGEQAARRQALRAAGSSDLSAREALPYEPSGGFSEAKLGATLNWSLGPRWVASGSLGYSRLLGDAADSPLTRRRSGTSASVALLYKF
ncbi:MipA/OmpV family protein [uncultured Tolumonas sp.]|uniref:MipA/OmpV family protein n=1 Tax=uncultured Tolumonas sp. TaxID=263765 RepID=UPI002930D73D|nr:MipA/OmpV family protein [uncultured Tolumonas sp.]